MGLLPVADVEIGTLRVTELSSVLTRLYREIVFALTLYDADGFKTPGNLREIIVAAGTCWKLSTLTITTVEEIEYKVQLTVTPVTKEC